MQRVCRSSSTSSFVFVLVCFLGVFHGLPHLSLALVFHGAYFCTCFVLWCNGSQILWAHRGCAEPFVKKRAPFFLFIFPFTRLKF